ncbi:MAG: type II toxin-antitoxin system MqsA family antitoxin [Candidatus Ozemobacteraceae bacterium]
MKCDLCGKDGVKTKKVSRSYGKGLNLFVIENIPVLACSQCGESYLAAETLHEIERIRLHKDSLAKQRSVPVIAFA